MNFSHFLGNRKSQDEFNDNYHILSTLEIVSLIIKVLNIMKTTVTIQNLKCDGCKNAIKKRLLRLSGISNVSVNVFTSEVTFHYTTHNALEGLRESLADLGYPITGEPNTIVDRAKSYIQCAIGKMSI